MKRDPSLIDRIEDALTAKLAEQLGNDPVKSPLLAWVFEAIK